MFWISATILLSSKNIGESEDEDMHLNKDNKQVEISTKFASIFNFLAQLRTVLKMLELSSSFSEAGF